MYNKADIRADIRYEVFKQSFAEYYRRLYRYAYSFLKDKELAKDVVLLVFTGLLRKGPGSQELKKIGRYLYQGVYNFCHEGQLTSMRYGNHRRKRLMFLHDLLIEHIEGNSTPKEAQVIDDWLADSVTRQTIFQRAFLVRNPQYQEPDTDGELERFNKIASLFYS